jgi:hypothetical protein
LWGGVAIGRRESAPAETPSTRTLESVFGPKVRDQMTTPGRVDDDGNVGTFLR